MFHSDAPWAARGYDHGQNHGLASISQADGVFDFLFGDGGGWSSDEAAPSTHIWARGDGADVVRTMGLGDGSKLVLRGVTASQVSFQRSGKDVTLVIAPSTPGGSDGGSVKLAGFNPSHGLSTIVLNGVTWTAAELAAKVLASQVTSGNDTIAGFSIADQLSGGAGDDRLAGGRGNDTYSWSRGDGHDVIDETGRQGGRADTLKLDGVKAADVSFRIVGQDVTLTIAPSTAGGANGGSVTLLAMDPRGARGVETVQLADGSWTADQIRALALAAAATAGNDTIAGFTGNDTIAGGAGNDLLDGRGGNDRFEGGTGNDSYVVDGRGDTVVEKAGEGVDTVFSSGSFTLGDNVENLTLTGAAASYGAGNGLANVLTGNSARNVLEGGGGNDTLDGGSGADVLKGGAGDDVYIVNSRADAVREAAGAGTDTVFASISYRLDDNVENLVLTGTAAINATGNALANSLTGNAGANLLDGRGGDDTMTGGAGDDTYIVNGKGDAVIEETGGGADTVKASVSYALAANVENLVLTGRSAIDGAGNALDNKLTGNAAANVLDGGAGNDVLTGGGGHDSFVFIGAFGSDTVTDFHAGKAGHDVLQLSLGESYDSFAEVIAAAHEVNGNTVFDFGSHGTITLEGVTLADIRAEDVLFV